MKNRMEFRFTFKFCGSQLESHIREYGLRKLNKNIGVSHNTISHCICNDSIEIEKLCKMLMILRIKPSDTFCTLIKDLNSYHKIYNGNPVPIFSDFVTYIDRKDYKISISEI